MPVMYPWRRCLYDDHHWFIAEDSPLVWLNNHPSQKCQTRSSNQRTVADWSFRTNHCLAVSVIFSVWESLLFKSASKESWELQPFSACGLRLLNARRHSPPRSVPTHMHCRQKSQTCLRWAGTVFLLRTLGIPFALPFGEQGQLVSAGDWTTLGQPLTSRLGDNE